MPFGVFFSGKHLTGFANDRMIADGDISNAIRLVRCLNKMEALILPKMVAQLAVKEYPSNLSLKEN